MGKRGMRCSDDEVDGIAELKQRVEQMVEARDVGCLEMVGGEQERKYLAKRDDGGGLQQLHNQSDEVWVTSQGL